jgi:SAM-dependent methyltransferase
MYAELLPMLRCLACAHHPLTLLGPIEEHGEIVAGALRCDACGDQTPIRSGVWDAHGDAPLSYTPTQLTNYLPLTARIYERAWRWTALSLMSGRHLPLREELTLVRELMQPESGQLFVDIACSAGLYARALAGPGVVVAGIDHSMPFLVEARRRANERGLRVSYIRCTAQRLPFVFGSAAGAVMGGSLNEIGDQAGALNEVWSVLRPNGRFFCMNLVAADSAGGKLMQRVLGTGGIDFPTLDQLNRSFAYAGLKPRAQWRWRVVAITLLERQAASITYTKV